MLLLNKVKESLAGRCVIEEVLPLTLPEMLTDSWDEELGYSYFQRFLTEMKIEKTLPSLTLYADFSNREKTFRYYLNNGGYPALVKEGMNDDERFEWLKMYVRTYLERDVRELANFRNLDPFVKIQKMSALMTAQLLNVVQLSNEADVSSPTARKFLQYLEISYQIIMLQPWSRNKLKRLVKMPKLHFLDPGVQRAILNKRGMLSGHEYESAVVAEIYKQVKTAKVDAGLFHLRTHDGAEVDLLLEFETGYVAIEVKMTENVMPRDARHLKKLDYWLDKPVIHSFILSNDNSVKKFGERITAMPAAMFLT
jgi:predicted AAA+ superfamily ATPase